MEEAVKEAINLAHLRKVAPSWEWKAERYGFGYRYHGYRLRDHVLVSAFSVLSGPSDDDFSTQWRADDGTRSFSYAHWLIAHSGDVA